MGSARLLSMVMFQGGDSSGSDHMQWLVIFVGVIAFCSFVQFLVFVGAGIAALRAYKSVSAELSVLKGKAMPIVASVQGVVEDLRPKISTISGKVQEIMEDATPKVKTVTTNVADISNVARSKVHEFEATLDKANDTVRAANEKTRAQVDRVDGMVSSALKATSDVGSTIHRGIRTPVLEVAGVVNGLKAALDVLVGRVKPATGFKSAADRPYRTPGPTPVPSAESVISPHPSSNVAPSPGAAAVIDRLRGEKIKTIY